MKNAKTIWFFHFIYSYFDGIMLTVYLQQGVFYCDF